ncbi:diacylglycerol kinase family lipid kinase [Bacillus sp. BRMEA1]|nr:diacylglycerol kinase family lipid kinase [Neobacillus endophyticus]
MEPIYFIINPKAGNGSCLKVWGKVQAELQRKQIPYLAFFTEYGGHAERIAAQIGVENKLGKLIIAVGGDGTMHEVLNGMSKHKNITLGFIPGGSGNDFSRGFSIPADPIKALTVILRSLKKQEKTRVDFGKMFFENETGHYFLNNMGAGFDALIAFKANQSRIKALFNQFSLGRLVYVYFLLKELFTYKTSTLDISIDGKKHIFEQTWFVTVSNQPYYGGGMQIAPDALPDDGLFNITVVHQLSRWKLLFVFISVFWGKHIYFKEVKRFKGRAISIQPSLPLYVHGDGEHIGWTPLKIELWDRALQIVTRLKNKEEVDLEMRDLNDFH